MSELKFLACSDLEGRHDLIEMLLEADLSRYDCLVYKGDTPDPEVYKKLRKSKSLGGRPWAERTSTSMMEESPEVRSAFRKAVEDSARINGLFASIRKKLPIYGVLGNSDTVPTRIAPHLGLEPVNFSDNMQMLHNTVVQIKGFNFIGYHGRVKYLGENIVEAPDLMFEEERACEELSRLFEIVDPRSTILVTHMPPYGILDKVNESWISYGVSTYGDKAKDGHIGSDAFREVVLKYQPLLHTFGHVHETPGVTRKGETTFFNGGALGETAEIEEVTIKDGTVDCKWIRLVDL